MNGNYNNGIPNGYDYAPNNESVSLNEVVAKGVRDYFNAKKYFNLLTGDNQNLVAKAGYVMEGCQGIVRQLIDAEMHKHYTNARTEGQLDSLNNVVDFKQKSQTRALVKQDEAPMSRRAAFINIAILIYGSLNIGFIIALALLK